MSMDDLPIYIPHPIICHMEQYNCCKHHQDCRLYDKCSNITKQTVCKRDCTNCTYLGCSLSAENRRIAPVYVAGVIQSNRIELNLDIHYMIEQLEHKREHKKLYHKYNRIFGDLREKNKAKCRAYYYEHRSTILHTRKIQRENNASPLKIPSEQYLPPCGLRCEECVEADCILPENWREKALNLERNKRYYDAHREMLLEKQKNIRATPHRKMWVKEYDRQYRVTHREQVNAKSKRWREQHPDRARAAQQKYRMTHREEINEKRRAKRHGL